MQTGVKSVQISHTHRHTPCHVLIATQSGSAMLGALCSQQCASTTQKQAQKKHTAHAANPGGNSCLPTRYRCAAPFGRPQPKKPDPTIARTTTHSHTRTMCSSQCNTALSQLQAAGDRKVMQPALAARCTQQPGWRWTHCYKPPHTPHHHSNNHSAQPAHTSRCRLRLQQVGCAK